MGLGGIFDDLQAVLPGNLEDGTHVGRMAVQVNGDDGLGAKRRALCLQVGPELLGRQGENAGIDVHKDGLGVGGNDAADRRDRRIGRGDDRVPRLDPAGPQRQVQGFGSRANPDGLAGPAVDGELALEPGELFAQDVSAAFQRARDRAVNLYAQPTILPGEIQKGHLQRRHEWLPPGEVTPAPTSSAPCGADNSLRSS